MKEINQDEQLEGYRSFRTALLIQSRAHHRREYHILGLLYSLLHDVGVPGYLRDCFQYRTMPDARLRPRRVLDLMVPTYNSTAYKKSFAVMAARLWNLLPDAIRETPSIATFKRQLKYHILADPRPLRWA
ncbi:hypothetical protein ACJJTC_005408 [Scirpophaga incertulas]